MGELIRWYREREYMDTTNGNGTLTAFLVMTVIFTVILVIGADLSGFAGWLVAAIVGIIGAVIAIGAWAIGKNLSK